MAASRHRLEVWQPADAEPPPRATGYAAVMTFGGGMHPDQERSHPWLAEERRWLAAAVEQSVPVLAVCLGAEVLAHSEPAFRPPA